MSLSLRKAVLAENPQKNKRYFSTVSIGKQTMVSGDCICGPTAELEWDSGAEFVIHDGGASMVRVALFRRGKLEGALRNDLVGYSEIDLHPLIVQGRGSYDENVVQADETYDLLDPNTEKRIGYVQIEVEASDIVRLERQLWEHLLTLGDWGETSSLSIDEFGLVLKSLGSEASHEDVKLVFERARSVSSDKDSAKIDIKSLAEALGGKGDGSSIPYFLPTCPVDGAELSPDPKDSASNILYVWLCLSSTETNHERDLKYGYITEGQAARSWVMRLSEWACHPVRKKRGRMPSTKKIGSLHVGQAAQHILVFDRENKRIIEEIVSPVLLLAMRTMYQSRMGRNLLKNERFLRRLTDLSIREGVSRDSLESAKDIPKFVHSFLGQIDVASAEKPLHEYRTFNEFFYRKLAPSARNIHDKDDNTVIVSSADCRLQVFLNADAATRFWVKGKNFSMAGLMGDDGKPGSESSKYFGGSLAIFRLAPQDYHRYHSPVTGTIKSITPIEGHLLTVNPIAVNSAYCDVFTVNKRAVMIIETLEYGDVAFVAIGATLVGSIFWTVEPGAHVAKGDELGYFAFGGSTCIAVFQPGHVEWDQDIVANGKRSLETLVKMGERIGCKSGRVEPQAVLDRAEKRLDAANTAAKDAGIVELQQRPTIDGSDIYFNTPIDALHAT